MSALDVLCPLPGTALAMSDVPDPVFAGAIVGPGLAVDPVRDGVVDAVAPISGKLLKLHPHAYVVQEPGGRAVLVHLGLDTVQLKGEGFTLHVAEGETVSAGQVLVSWNPAEIERGGRSPVVPVVAMEAGADALTMVAQPGGTLRAGDPLFTWA
ncbi:PTS glucose transporter subunit IIA [Georgenia sp. TF02-10]|uniref:PTS sugar transporter subunit IIA n=1 Tax=Georgenia sp. TF02-10 TaxID=2917725 RepID=UPI001FA7B8F1|nr:PTS glucose transporter subunit IIA [Georgenia sp. TF02-10]UNX55710.1 PTS glucose transporter subunit IIA [Georgenia sp. TF02-10]